MRKMFVLFSLLVVFSMALAACGPTPTEAPPAATDAPTEAATEVAPEEPSGPTSNYIGSGQLDGNGVPPDFFSDLHIRKAFAYSFDF